MFIQEGASPTELAGSGPRAAATTECRSYTADAPPLMPRGGRRRRFQSARCRQAPWLLRQKSRTRTHSNAESRPAQRLPVPAVRPARALPQRAPRTVLSQKSTVLRQKTQRDRYTCASVPFRSARLADIQSGRRLGPQQFKRCATAKAREGESFSREARLQEKRVAQSEDPSHTAGALLRYDS